MRDREGGNGVGIERGGVVAIGLGVERNFEVAEDGGEGHTIGKRSGLRLVLSLSNVATDEIKEVEWFLLQGCTKPEKHSMTHNCAHRRGKGSYK